MSKKQTFGSLSGVLLLGLLGLVSGSSYGLDRLVASDPEQKAHTDHAHRIRASRGLKHLFACGGHLSPTFLSLSREIREHDVELTIRYDANSRQTHARLRISPTLSGFHMTSVIYVPLRSKSRQLGSIGHELYHMLTVLQQGREGLLSVTEESRAKEIGIRVAKEAVFQARGPKRPVQDATEASSLLC